jgi:hypothetical protein
MHRLLTFIIFALLLALVVSFSVAGSAQTFRGAINGTVTDPWGAMVAGANVKATDTATGIAHTSTSDGQFAFQDLPLGSYKIEVSASGFSTVVVAQVPVTAGSVYTVPVRLKLGPAVHRD